MPRDSLRLRRPSVAASTSLGDCSVAVTPAEDRFGSLPRFCAEGAATSGSADGPLAGPAAETDWRLLTAMGLLACSQRHSRLSAMALQCRLNRPDRRHSAAAQTPGVGRLQQPDRLPQAERQHWQHALTACRRLPKQTSSSSSSTLEHAEQASARSHLDSRIPVCAALLAASARVAALGAAQRRNRHTHSRLLWGTASLSCRGPSARV